MMESFFCSATLARLGLLCSVSCLARVLGSIREREGPAAFGFGHNMAVSVAETGK